MPADQSNAWLQRGAGTPIEVKGALEPFVRLFGPAEQARAQREIPIRRADERNRVADKTAGAIVAASAIGNVAIANKRECDKGKLFVAGGPRCRDSRTIDGQGQPLADAEMFGSRAFHETVQMRPQDWQKLIGVRLQRAG